MSNSTVSRSLWIGDRVVTRDMIHDPQRDLQASGFATQIPLARSPYQSQDWRVWLVTKSTESPESHSMFIDHPRSTSSLNPVFPFLCDSFTSPHQTFVLETFVLETSLLQTSLFETSLLQTMSHSRDRCHPRFGSVPYPLMMATLLMIRLIRVNRGLKAASHAVANRAKTLSHCSRMRAQNRKIGPNWWFDANRMIPETCSRVWKSIVKSMARACVCPILLKTLGSPCQQTSYDPFKSMTVHTLDPWKRPRAFGK